MDTYLFSVFTSGLFHWETMPQKQPYKIIGMTSSYVMLRGNKEGLLQLKILRPHDVLIGALSYFIENKSLNLYFVCPISMRLDVLGCSSAYQRSLKENGVLLKEYDLLHFLNTWRDRVQYLPDSSLQCSDVITNSCDLVMRSESPPPYDERCAMATVGTTPEFHGFGVFDQEYNYTQAGFSRVNPTKLTKLRGNRTSLIYLPASAPMKSCISVVQEMAKKLEFMAPEPYTEDGRRIKCSLVLDEFAPSVDTRLLTPGNLDVLGVLFMKPTEYFAWISKSEEKFQTLESSVFLREAVFKSTLDYRFSPPPFMYQWKVFAFNSLSRMSGSLPHSDWTAIIINASPLDYCKKSLSYYVMNQVRNSGFFRGGLRFEYFNSLERSIFKVPFPKKICVKIYTCDVANQYERTLEKSFKDKPEDHFMATMGFLKLKPMTGFFPASELLAGLAGAEFMMDGNPAPSAPLGTSPTGTEGVSPQPQTSQLRLRPTWSEKLFNLRIRKTAGFVYSEFIEDCFEGFALESAREILSCNAPDCCICCTNKTSVVLEGCGHSFCMVCLCTMLEGTANQGQGKVWEPCPNCRAPFSKDSMVQFRAYKTTRRKSREDSSLTRKRVLGHILGKRGTEEKWFIDKSPMVLDEDGLGESNRSGDTESPESLPPPKGDPSHGTASTLLVVQYDAALDKVMEWCPGVHCVSLQKFSMNASWQKMSRIILISPHLDLDSLEKLHGLLQYHTEPEFTVEIISLNFGSASSCEDFSWTSSLVEAYGAHEKSISALVL